MAWVSNLDAGAGLFFASVRIAAVLACWVDLIPFSGTRGHGCGRPRPMDAD
jgi:hypothetical protein